MGLFEDGAHCYEIEVNGRRLMMGERLTKRGAKQAAFNMLFDLQEAVQAELVKLLPKKRKRKP